MMEANSDWKSAIKFWELSRIAYNLLLAVASLLGYGLAVGVAAGVGDPRAMSGMETCVCFLICAIGANLCFTLGYAAEFLSLPFRQKLNIHTQRWLLMIVGTMLSVPAAFFAAVLIGQATYPV